MTEHSAPSHDAPYPASFPLDHSGWDRLIEAMDDPDDLYYLDSAWDFESGNPREGW